MEMQVIKRIISKENFRTYNIPDSFGDRAEIIILPYTEEQNITEDKSESYYRMKAQETNGTINLLNEPEEDAWDEL